MSSPPILLPVSLDPPQLVQRAVSDGRRLGMQLTYVEGLSRELKAAGATWFAPRRMWVRAVSSVDDAVTWLQHVHDGHWFDFSGARVPLQAALGGTEADFFSQLLDVQVFPLTTGGYAVSTRYDKFMLRALRGLRARFHPYASAWEVRHVTLDELLDTLDRIAGVARDYVFVHGAAVVLEAMSAAPTSPVPISVPVAPQESAPRGDAGDEEEKGTGFLSTLGDAIERVELDPAVLHEISRKAGLRDYQVTGVQFMGSRTSALNGDDMGLGKSRQTVVASWLAARFGEGRVLIACPASLRINWEREIRAVFPQARIGMVGEDRVATLHGCQWVIANYERLGTLVRESELHFDVMACDEAHMLKEHHAGRTRNAFILAKRIPRRFMVTGTPLLNREVELHTLLRLSGHPLGHLELKVFRERYAGSPDKRAALAEALQGWMIRRRKDVLKELGTKSRHLRWISPPEGLAAYQRTLHDPSLGVMPKITKLRQRLEALKTEFVIETAEGLAEGDKLIVFCEYMETVTTLKHMLSASGIRCVSLVGSDPIAKRQKAVDEFQNDPAVTVFITTTTAGGVGLTLTRATWVAFCSLPWTPALMRQAEDRAYRLGQTRDVNVLVPLIAGTIDEQVWRLLEAKMDIETGVVEAVRAELEVA